jgi:dolichol-phosphate mannosyltransferase
VHRIARRRGVRQFVKFAIVGFSGLIVNIVIFTILQTHAESRLQHARYNWNYSIGFLSGGVSNYLLNRLWTFRASGHALLQGLQFIIGLADRARRRPRRLARARAVPRARATRPGSLATFSAIGVNFFINKYWTFRES